MNIALLSTSQCRKDTYGPDHNTITNTEPSELLTRLVQEGFEIYLVSTRPRLHPVHDGFLLELIPEERRFLPEEGSETGHAQAPGLIEMWKRVLDTFDIPHPPSTTYDDYTIDPTWLDYRTAAGEKGITV